MTSKLPLAIDFEFSRNHALDGLRGILALSIVFYHLIESLQLPMPNWLAITGLMGVEAFFVLSGYALARVYWNSDFCSFSVFSRYIKKRVLRIAPLLYLATIAVAGSDYFVATLVLLIVVRAIFYKNLTLVIWFQSLIIFIILGYLTITKLTSTIPTISLLWGFLDPTLSIAGGSWSIGLELVFYCFLPFVIIFTRRDSRFLWLIVVFIVFVSVSYQLLYDTSLLPSSVELGIIKQHWQRYVHIYNHAYFFIAGVVLHSLEHRLIKLPLQAVIILLLLTILLYIFSANNVAADHGIGRLFFSLLTTAIVWNVALINFKNRLLIHIFQYFGDISYGVYLLHFPIHSLLHPYSSQFSTEWHELVTTILLVLIISTLVRVWFEKSFGVPKPLVAGLPSSTVKDVNH